MRRPSRPTRGRKINPDYAQAYNNLGTALADLEQYEASIAAYEQALAINPDFAAAQENLSVVQALLEATQE